MKRIQLHPTVFLALFAVLASGCDTVSNPGDDERSAGVIVVSQGNFGDANGSVSAYDPVAKHVRTAVISNTGSILQSAALIGDSIYLMANTGERIDVYNAETFEQTGQIVDIISPRYMIADDSTGYVTNLYEESGTFTGGKVTVIDLDLNQKSREIVVGSNPEGLALAGDRLYVANFGFGEGNTVSVIDIDTEEVIDTIDVECDGPRFLSTDADLEVFVFCTGRTIFDENFEPIGETQGAVRVLDGATGAIIERFDIQGRIGSEGPGQDAFHSPESGSIYVVKNQNSILVFDTEENRLRHEIGPLDGDPIGAVAYDGRAERLYLGRVAGFVEAGSVTIHRNDGSEIDRFIAGIAPAYIIFSNVDS